LFSALQAAGFEVLIKNHASAIFRQDFPAEAGEIVNELFKFRIPIEDLLASGGGESAGTIRMRRSLAAAGWTKHNFQVQKFIDGVEYPSVTHEIDQIKRTPSGVVALEIEWNNKDPFFDRDLENFYRLHAQSVISAGIIITRGSSMQSALPALVEQCLIKHGVVDETGLTAFKMKARTARQSSEVAKRLKKSSKTFAEVFARSFCADKFGPATTHWNKLLERVNRGVGNPCPLVLIGLPDTIIDP
jgi:hypothetical protein